MESVILEEYSRLDLTARRPVLAILTIEDEVQLFRGNRSNFADLILMGQSMGFIVYVLTVKNLYLTRSQLRGFAYEEESQSWKLQLFPFPDIIYNRIPQREDELLPSVRKKLAACAKSSRVKLFNPSFFNKWHLFEWLKTAHTTKPFIPCTRKLVSQVGLGRMLRTHPYLYLKPESGKAGNGIMTIRVNGEKELPYRLKIQEDKKSATYKCSSLSKLWTRIQKQTAGEAYIAQQGIVLAAFNERRFDLRALVQKNGRGQWDITGIGARVAGSSSITTHVPRGGSIEDPEKLLISSFDADLARRILIRTKNTALLIAKQIERGSGAILGEMSMDLGIDSSGNIWFFEANSKPMKFDEPHIRKKSLERIFHYGLFLTQKNAEQAGGA
ncbi:YheC/YheD family protein [Paenibacillus sp. GCM10023252]|uniref:YheC/YheD family endospore coat-associated protein n=1 Tax=Paenibacillus sp. GCM10023252 TaxID=3252649 RepID=UPI0036165B91